MLRFTKQKYPLPKNSKGKTNKMKQHKSLINELPSTLPALEIASQQGAMAASVGFDWTTVEQVISKVEEEWNELLEAIENNDIKAIEHEIGDTLMSLASLARHLGINGEKALCKANHRFRNRFITMEHIACQKQQSLEALNEQDLDELWEKAKTSLQNNESSLK